jgi:hypothetical protein
VGEIRPGSKTLETVLKTDELYGHDGLWLGPRGRDYGVILPDPKPYQHANLYPDPNSSYWFAFLGNLGRRPPPRTRSGTGRV